MNPIIHLPASLINSWKEASESCTIVHCTFISFEPVKLRVWKKRTLLRENTGLVRKIIKPFNIDITLLKTFKPDNGCCNFTLVFEGLSRNCTSFELYEEPPAINLFFSESIERNRMDAYQVIVKRRV